MKYIAFVCGHNSGRSQMAQAAFNNLKRIDSKVDQAFEAISWGTGIGDAVNRKVISVMSDLGIDLSDSAVYFPKDVEHPAIREQLGSVVQLITMGCMDNQCEIPSGVIVSPSDIRDWGLADPASDNTDIIAVRDSILGRSLELIRELSESL